MSERPRLPHVPGAWLVGLAIAGGAMVAGLSHEQSRRLILAAQSEGEVALAKGLAVGLADPLVTQDYGGMEARLEQAMADSTIASALVIDPEGRVLVHLQRRRPTEPTELLFQPRRISPPRAASAATPSSARWNDRWMAIEAGAPVGWLRLRIWSRRTDAVLNLLLLGAQPLRRQSQLREQRVQAEREELDRSAHTDPLTGVWNRRGVERELQRLLGSPQALLHSRRLPVAGRSEPRHACRRAEAGAARLRWIPSADSACVPVPASPPAWAVAIPGPLWSAWP